MLRRLHEYLVNAAPLQEKRIAIACGLTVVVFILTLALLRVFA